MGSRGGDVNFKTGYGRELGRFEEVQGIHGKKMREYGK